MNVTGVEWRQHDYHEGEYTPRRQGRRVSKPADPDDDFIEIHDEGAEGGSDPDWIDLQNPGEDEA